MERGIRFGGAGIRRHRVAATARAVFTAMVQSDYIIFADESGNPNLKRVDSNYPVFVFCCCVFRRHDYAAAVAPAVAALNAAHFGERDVILHSRPIRIGEPPFDFQGDPQRRAAFMEDLNRVITDADFTVIATVVKLDPFQQHYRGDRSVDRLAFRQCVIRLNNLLQSRGQHNLDASLVVESRGEQDDRRLLQEYQAIRSNARYSGRTPPNFELRFDAKGNNTAGVQIADLVAHPIGNHIANPQQHSRAWDTISTKLRRSPQGAVNGWGLITLPDPTLEMDVL